MGSTISLLHAVGQLALVKGCCVKFCSEAQAEKAAVFKECFSHGRSLNQQRKLNYICTVFSLHQVF